VLNVNQDPSWYAGFEILVFFALLIGTWYARSRAHDLPSLPMFSVNISLTLYPPLYRLFWHRRRGGKPADWSTHTSGNMLLGTRNHAIGYKDSGLAPGPGSGDGHPSLRLKIGSTNQPFMFGLESAAQTRFESQSHDGRASFRISSSHVHDR
jgi:hypothetical protein